MMALDAPFTCYLDGAADGRFQKVEYRYYAGEFTRWRESYELWPAGDLAVTPADFHFTPCSTLSKYFVTCSSEKRRVRRAR